MATVPKYKELLDKNWVFEKLLTMTQAELAEEIGCPRSSVAWVTVRYFTSEERSQIKIARKHKPKT